jgi:hypothetical protein
LKKLPCCRFFLGTCYISRCPGKIEAKQRAILDFLNWGACVFWKYFIKFDSAIFVVTIDRQRKMLYTLGTPADIASARLNSEVIARALKKFENICNYKTSRTSSLPACAKKLQIALIFLRRDFRAAIPRPQKTQKTLRVCVDCFEMISP